MSFVETSGADERLSEAEIFGRVIQADKADMAPEAAHFILSLTFSKEDQARVDDLSSKASEGSLSKTEREQLQSYNHVAHLVALLQSKARKSLKQSHG